MKNQSNSQDHANNEAHQETTGKWWRRSLDLAEKAQDLGLQHLRVLFFGIFGVPLE